MESLERAAAADLCRAGLMRWGQGCLAIDQRAAAILDCPALAGPSRSPAALLRLPFRRRDRLFATLRALRSGSSAGHCSLVLCLDTGESRHIDLAARVGSRGEAVFAIADVTEYRRALGEVDATLKTVPSAMVVMDERGLVRAFSDTAERMFGYSASDMIGRRVDVLMPEAYRAAHHQSLGRYLRSHEPRVIGRSRYVQAQRCDGSVFPAEIWIGEALTNGERLFTGFLRDQTNRLEIEAKLQELQDNLVHASRLSAMGELSLALAHELNQPLATLVNYLAVAAHHAAELPANIGRDLQTALADGAEQAMRAGEIVKRLRAFVERDEAHLTVEPVDRIVGEATSMLASLAQRRGIELQIALPGRGVRALADRVQVQQVLVNLIRNAIAAVEPEDQARRTIRISASVLGDQVEFAVEDDGPGVEPALEPLLFSRFSTSTRGGMGVGLSISRRIVEAHGGELLYRRASSGGARFSFRLPRWEGTKFDG